MKKLPKVEVLSMKLECIDEKLSSEALRNSGYDQNGWPYSPCGIPTKPKA